MRFETRCYEVEEHKIQVNPVDQIIVTPWSGLESELLLVCFLYKLILFYHFHHTLLFIIAMYWFRLIQS